MANLRTLAKDTAVYGLSSIVGRFLNYLLVPLYTARLAAESGGYGIVTNVYSYVALLLVLLTFGMETSFFRFAGKKEEPLDRVYGTALAAVGTVGALFVASVALGLGPLSALMGYADHPEYLMTMALCVALDAFQCIPFAYLRQQGRALKFAALKLLFIVVNIALNLIYFLLMGGRDVLYVFALNLATTALVTLCFHAELRAPKSVDLRLLRRMLSYGWPILVLGVAGILNQTFDKIAYPLLVPGQAGRVELGIYGASVKIAMIMAMITQAFRYAYEPFVFGAAGEGDHRATYARAMKYFVIFTLLAFLCVTGWMDVLKYLIAPGYWAGLRAVPVVMAAEILMGVYFNLSFWYKLTDRTLWGAWLSGAGCAVLIAVNLVFVPRYGYMASAWAGVAGYGTATVLSYLAGRRYYPIDYPLRSLCVYTALAGAFFALMQFWPDGWGAPLRLALNTGLILLFAAHIAYHDFPLERLPKVGKFFRR